VPSLAEVARQHGRLEPAAVSWLQRLVSDWHLVADLSFADLLLWIPDPDGSRLCVGAQARPTTGPTAYSDDLVGQMLPAAARPLVVRALETGVISRDGDPQWRDTVPVRLEAIPVRHDDTVIAVIARSTNMLGIRMPSRLELAYLQAATDLAVMISEGTFPSLADRTDLPSLPRVGDGMLRLDPAGVVTYASPNALSAYRRFGFAGNLLGSHLGRVTARLAPSDSATDEALSGMVSGESFRATEIDSPDGTLVVRSLPLTRRRERIGALVLVRDVTDLRSRERELLSKDATIREIHHRVKNNLQTVAALLRLQARRTQAPEARSALQEAVRRVGSIAVVHETLSQGVEDAVDFDHVADRLLGLVADVSAPEATVTPIRSGSFGTIPSDKATPLALVLTELLHNAVEHGLQNSPGALMLDVTRSPVTPPAGTDLPVTFPGDRPAGPDRLRIVVEDDGQGIAEDFSIETTTSLGLQIVRSLVAGELDGTLAIGPRRGGGTQVVLQFDVPVD
jgi:two-component sensor histidine kinase